MSATSIGKYRRAATKRETYYGAITYLSATHRSIIRQAESSIGWRDKRLEVIDGSSAAGTGGALQYQCMGRGIYPDNLAYMRRTRR